MRGYFVKGVTLPVSDDDPVTNAVPKKQNLDRH